MNTKRCMYVIYTKGNCYPGSTLKNILTALLWVMKLNQGASNVIGFADKAEQEKHYPFLHNPLDRILRQLREHGIDIERKRASIITPDIDCKLWEVGAIGYNGKNFLSPWC